MLHSSLERESSNQVFGNFIEFTRRMNSTQGQREHPVLWMPGATLAPGSNGEKRGGDQSAGKRQPATLNGAQSSTTEFTKSIGN
jgi:hypothetical protein